MNNDKNYSNDTYQLHLLLRCFFFLLRTGTNFGGGFAHDDIGHEISDSFFNKGHL